jgi:hypothetical protein
MTTITVDRPPFGVKCSASTNREQGDEFAHAGKAGQSCGTGILPPPESLRAAPTQHGLVWIETAYPNEKSPETLRQVPGLRV